MTTYSDLNAAIVAQLGGVTNIGAVHAYSRYIADWPTFLDQFKETVGGVEQIRGWFVTLANPAITNEPSAFRQRTRTYRFLITGILGVKDASATESTFIGLVEAVLDALDDETTLGVSGVVVGGFSPECRIVELRQFGSVLCHVAEIGLDVPVVTTG